MHLRANAAEAHGRGPRSWPGVQVSRMVNIIYIATNPTTLSFQVGANWLPPSLLARQLDFMESGGLAAPHRRHLHSAVAREGAAEGGRCGTAGDLRDRRRPAHPSARC